MAKVSVIVPIYNCEKYIERCAHSLFSQTLDDIQYIFIDDCTPDNSVGILKRVLENYPHRKDSTIVIKHQYNKGVSVARNTGLKLVKGEYIAYCDSDDFVDESMYEEMYVKALETNADAVLCDFYMHYSDTDNRYLQTIIVQDKVNTLREYIMTSWTLISNLIIKASVYRTNSIYFWEHITYCEDFHLNFRLLYNSNVITQVCKPFYYYNRSNDSSATHNLGERELMAEKLVYEDIIKMMKRDETLPFYHKEMSYRILKCKQDMILSPKMHADFMAIYPESHKYICSCPTYFCNRKIKLMMWLLVHHCRWILLILLYVRRKISK